MSLRCCFYGCSRLFCYYASAGPMIFNCCILFGSWLVYIAYIFYDGSCCIIFIHYIDRNVCLAWHISRPHTRHKQRLAQNAITNRHQTYTIDFLCLLLQSVRFLSFFFGSLHFAASSFAIRNLHQPLAFHFFSFSMHRKFVFDSSK